ncbi:2-dehydro-3-deoxygalactonokinase [Devosia sp.]|uniref:2-dehydro-3-deoxygalactonokinase n=1 Tax=Devosia sp. TaxID=1871048 RepID=UPI001B045724|nr:2-dehydro-3-deoxygalactonokinase [Devosia sp.]MBO9590899.1 2-dehydro-3-deoxygalactonokinase [Devosia sp.]
MTDTSRPDWIAVDWGTSNLRVWAMRGDAAPDLLTDSNRGMSRLKPDQFATVLDEACASIPDVMGLDAMVCGMAGARDGWQEAPSEMCLFAVGGAEPDNFALYAAAGCTGVGLGTFLYQPGHSAKDCAARAELAVNAFRRHFVERSK